MIQTSDWIPCAREFAFSDPDTQMPLSVQLRHGTEYRHYNLKLGTNVNATVDTRGHSTCPDYFGSNHR